MLLSNGNAHGVLNYLGASPLEQCCMNRGVSTGCMDLCRKRTRARAGSNFPSNTRCEKYKPAINMCWNEGTCKLLSKWSIWIACLKNNILQMKRLTYFICMNRKVSPHEQCCVNYGVSTGCLDLCRKRANYRSRSTFPRDTKCEKHKHVINMCWDKGMCKIISKWSKWITCLNM